MRSVCSVCSVWSDSSDSLIDPDWLGPPFSGTVLTNGVLCKTTPTEPLNLQRQDDTTRRRCGDRVGLSTYSIHFYLGGKRNWLLRLRPDQLGSTHTSFGGPGGTGGLHNELEE